MQPKATPAQRFYAYTTDLVVFLSFFFLSGRIIWMLHPDLEIPVEAMVLFTPREEGTYFWTVAIGMVAGMLYFLILPGTAMCSGTIGQRLFGVRVARHDGSKLRWTNVLSRTLILLFKVGLVCLPGPFIAFTFQDSLLAIIALVFPLCFLVATSVISWSRPNGSWVWEDLGGYVYLSDRSKSADESRTTSSES